MSNPKPNDIERPDDETDLSLDDPDLIEKLQQRGTDEEGAISWEQLRLEIERMCR